MVFPFLLVGCGASPPRTSSANHPPDVIRSGDDSSGTTLTIDPLLPPDAGLRPPRPGETGRDRNEQGLPILEAKGLNVEKLFSEDIKDPTERIKRLENTVLEMRRDFDAVLPAINRLLAIEADIQELTTQLQTLLNEEGKGPGLSAISGEIDSIAPLDVPELSPPSAPNPADDVIKKLKSNTPKTTQTLNPDILGEPVPPPTPPTQVKSVAPPVIPPVRPNTLPKVEPQPQKSIGGEVVRLSDIRLGHHQNKLRVVIDVPRDATFTADLDNKEHVLVIDLLGVRVEAGRQPVKSSPLVKNMALEAAKDQKKNGRVVFELGQETKILMSTLMPPTGDKASARVVIDLDLPGSKPK